MLLIKPQEKCGLSPLNRLISSVKNDDFTYNLGSDS